MIDLTLFAQILQDAGLGTRGVDIFCDYMPSDKEGVLLLNDIWGIPYDPYLPGYYSKGLFQAIVRKKSVADSKELAYNIVKELTIMQQRDLGTIVINECYPKYQPIIYQRSESGLLEISTQFILNYVEIN